jgi:imidazole glycerol-phosphate synthase subunit HisH
MIYIIDYGLGNLGAFYNIYKRLNIETRFAKNCDDLVDVDKIILPGVGAFDHAMELLNASGMRDKLDQLVLVDKIPVIGICVGMQILGKSSEEGKLDGLGWIEGVVKKIDISLIEYQTKLPHMGWNNINILQNDPLFKKLDSNALFYFLHSYYFECHDKNDILAQSQYGNDFSCVINRRNIYGVQFHPEKSHQYGITLLNNFANLNNA